MMKNVAWSLLLTAGLSLIACSDEETGTPDAGQQSTDASKRNCPVITSSTMTGTGRIQATITTTTPPIRRDINFTIDSDFSDSGDELIYRLATGEGLIETNSAEADDVEIKIDILKEPLEGTYTADTERLKIRMIDDDVNVLVAGSAPNTIEHVIEITCWDPEELRLDGTFRGSWFEDASTTYLGWGEVDGEFSVQLTSQ
jgi:hypothetical protein